MAQTIAAASHLSAELTEFLQSPQPVLVTTLDAETKWPTNNLITWVLALDNRRVRLAADTGGRIMRNIEADPRVLLTVMARGACHSIEGTARMVTGRVEGVDLKLSVAEVEVQTVRDVTFVGGTVTGYPTVDVTYDRNLKLKLDEGVFRALRQG